MKPLGIRVVAVVDQGTPQPGIHEPTPWPGRHAWCARRLPPEPVPSRPPSTRSKASICKDLADLPRIQARQGTAIPRSRDSPGHWFSRKDYRLSAWPPQHHQDAEAGRPNRYACVGRHTGLARSPRGVAQWSATSSGLLIRRFRVRAPARPPSSDLRSSRLAENPRPTCPALGAPKGARQFRAPPSRDHRGHRLGRAQAHTSGRTRRVRVRRASQRRCAASAPEPP